jgi:hypothetical protein
MNKIFNLKTMKSNSYLKNNVSLKSMKSNRQIKIFLTIFLLFCLFCSCSIRSRQKTLNELITKYEYAITNCGSQSSGTISNIISQIQDYLEKYPNSKKRSDLTNYIVQLTDCLDRTKIGEYIKQYEFLISDGSSDLDDVIKRNKQFVGEFDSDYGKKLINRQPVMRTYILDINKLIGEFENMQKYFNQTFSSLNSFHYSTQSNAGRFENSNYETIRKSWEYSTTLGIS